MTCVHPSTVFRARKARRDKMLLKMSNMRAAKERKRMERPLPEREPRFVRWYPLELGLRDKLTGETAWVDFRSLRDALRRLAIVKKYYV